MTNNEEIKCQLWKPCISKYGDFFKEKLKDYGSVGLAEKKKALRLKAVFLKIRDDVLEIGRTYVSDAIMILNVF